MIKKLGAAIVLAFVATPALADHPWPVREPVHYSDPSSGSSSSSTGGSVCDRCGSYGPPHDPVDVPAPPAVLLFAAATMALMARRRLGSAS